MKFVVLLTLAIQDAHCFFGRGCSSSSGFGNSSCTGSSSSFSMNFLGGRCPGKYRIESSCSDSSGTSCMSLLQRRCRKKYGSDSSCSDSSSTSCMEFIERKCPPRKQICPPCPKPCPPCPPRPSPRYIEVLKNLKKIQLLLREFSSAPGNISREAFGFLYIELRNHFRNLASPALDAFIRSLTALETALVGIVDTAMANISTKTADLITDLIEDILAAVNANSLTFATNYDAYAQDIVDTAVGVFISTISNANTGLIATMTQMATAYNTSNNTSIDTAMAQFTTDLGLAIDQELNTAALAIQTLMDAYLARGKAAFSEINDGEREYETALFKKAEIMVIDGFRASSAKTLAYIEHLLKVSIKLLHGSSDGFATPMPLIGNNNYPITPY